MTGLVSNDSFKKAVYISLSAHVLVFILIVISPHLPKPKRTGLIHYIPLNLVSGGAGGGSGGRPGRRAAAPAKKETLRELTTVQKAQPGSKSTMRYPTEKPKVEPKSKTEKKAAISKPEPAPPEDTAEGAAQGQEGGMGTGLRIGTGEGSGGGGWGPGGPGGGFGLANFPYTWYLNIITDRVSGNWFSSLVDPGVAGSFQTVVYFRIQKDGQISDVKVEQSSGLTPLDLSAMRAVRSSAPFPPLPRDYQDAYLAIHLIFEHAK
jgi:TonB family protein